MPRPFARAFYNSELWQNTREYILLRDAYLCQICGAPAEEVHHKIHLSPANIGDPKVTVNPDNLVSLCRNCHFDQHKADIAERVAKANRRRKHRRITEEDGTYFDEDGMVNMRKVYIVYGSPRSGKTTYVREHKEQGDVVIDLDSIIEALQGDGQRHADNTIRFLAMDVRDYLYHLLEEKSKDYDCKHVWIIAGLPHKMERDALAKRFNAQLIYIETTQEEAEARARAEDLYDEKGYGEYVVRLWWRKYEP